MMNLIKGRVGNASPNEAHASHDKHGDDSHGHDAHGHDAHGHDEHGHGNHQRKIKRVHMPLAHSHHHEETFFELFYDLIIVVVLMKLSYLKYEFTWFGVFTVVAIFGNFWSCWSNLNVSHLFFSCSTHACFLVRACVIFISLTKYTTGSELLPARCMLRWCTKRTRCIAYTMPYTLACHSSCRLLSSILTILSSILRSNHFFSRFHPS